MIKNDYNLSSGVIVWIITMGEKKSNKLSVGLIRVDKTAEHYVSNNCYNQTKWLAINQMCIRGTIASLIIVHREILSNILDQYLENHNQ